MKASKLIQDLARQIGEHGDLDVHLVIDAMSSQYSTVSAKAISSYSEDGNSIDIYGEER